MKTIHGRASNLVDAQPLASSLARTRGARPLALVALSLVAAGACGKSAPAISQTGNALTQAVLGTAQSFAVLGGTTVTNTGATTVDGNLGVAPGLAVTGFPPGLVADGSIHAGDAVALQAQHDTTTAYNALAAEVLTVDLTGQDLGGMTLVAGVYHFSSSAQLTGRLSLDAQGDPNAVFVFQVGSTLTTASDSSVVVLNGATDCNVFWQVGSSATLGTTTAFKGSLLALTSITLNKGATVTGRALARNAAVTMDTNDVSMSTCAVSSDAGIGEGIVPENDSASASDTSPETSSGGDSASAFNGDSSVGSDSGSSRSDSGSDSGGSSSGADAQGKRILFPGNHAEDSERVIGFPTSYLSLLRDAFA
jgi:type VI secretion system secreted protein VgrG